MALEIEFTDFELVADKLSDLWQDHIGGKIKLTRGERVGRDRQSEIARGRRLIEQGSETIDMLEQLAVVAYLNHQRDIVRRRGCCGRHETWITPMGQVVCKHTRDPCPREALAGIIQTWAQINRGTNEYTSRFARRPYRAGRQP